MKPCLVPGCPALVPTGTRTHRCPTHQRAWDRARWYAPARAAYRDPGYRNLTIAATCSVEDCNEPATKDHIIELNDGGINDPSNIQPLCLRHNVAKSNRQRKSSEG